MKKFIRQMKKLILLILGISLLTVFLLIGPLFINYVYIAETVTWNVNLTFSAGEMLQYYGAVVGGLITCFAIITTLHINNRNREQDRQRLQFERVYAVYHKLPDILAKLELAAIHVKYSIHLDEENLINTLDTMKESENVLREHHFSNDAHYSKNIESLLMQIVDISMKCQENVEIYLREKRSEGGDPGSSHKVMEDTFTELRSSITNTKSEIMEEINKFVYKFDNRW